MSSLLFQPDLGNAGGENTAEPVAKAFGQRYNGRYHLPLLPGERGTRSGGNWVPYGVQSATNLAGAIVESRQLGIWERQRTQIGLSLRPDLAERMAFLVRKNMGLDWNQLRATPEGSALLAELDLIHDEAKDAAGANVASRAGTNRHDVWEEAGRSGNLFGTPEINAQIERLEELLERKGLRRVPGLQERTVRNLELRAAGRFDDILQTTRDLPGVPAGTLLLADLKTKKRPFWSWLEVRIQLAVYATAEHMLTEDGQAYLPGPKQHVSQEWGVVMRMPADGGEPELRRINLITGLEHAKLARAVCDARSEGKSTAAHAESVWPDIDEETR